MKTRAAFFILILTFALPAFAADTPQTPPAPAASPSPKPSPAGPAPDVSVKAEVNRAAITIGDPVEYTVTFKHGADVQLASPIPAPDSDVLKIKSIQDIKTKEGKKTVEGKKFTLTTFRLGQFVLDPVQIQYKTLSGELRIISTDPIYLTVKSVAEGEAKTDIRGLKSVLELPPAILFAMLIIIGLAVFALAVLLLKFFRKSKNAAGEKKPDMTAEEEAYFLLNQLFDSDLLRRGKTKEYYLKLSEILRGYFERRFRILAIEYTTDEIIRALRQKEIPVELRERIQEVLQAADLAKFAKWSPEPTEIIQLNQKSKQIIELSKPPEETDVVS